MLRLTPVSEAEGRRFEFCLGHHLLPLSDLISGVGRTPPFLLCSIYLRCEHTCGERQELEKDEQIRPVAPTQLGPEALVIEPTLARIAVDCWLLNN